MKIIYLHQYFNTPAMTGSTRSYEMARRLVDMGCEVHVVTSIRDEQVKKMRITNEAGVTVHWIPVPYSNSMGFYSRMIAFLKFALLARNKAVELKGDLIFATSTPLTISIPGVLASRRWRVPMVFEVRDLWPEMPIAMGVLNNPILKAAARALERWSYRNSAAVVALSPGMKSGVVSAGYPASNVAVIPNSSDNFEFAFNKENAAAFRAKRPWLGEAPLLLYAGTIGKVNGVDYLVHLALALKSIESNVRVLVIGSGGEQKSVVEFAKKTGVLNEYLFLEGSLPKSEMPSAFSAATITSNLVVDIPEAQANSANKFFDSLAAGKPILINHGGWMHDIVARHECGLPLWRVDFLEAAQVVHSKANDSAWLELASVRAQKLAQFNFDRDRLAQQLRQVFDLVLAGSADKVQAMVPGDCE